MEKLKVHFVQMQNDYLAGGDQSPMYILIHQSSKNISGPLVCEVSSFSDLTLQSIDTPV